MLFVGVVSPLVTCILHQQKFALKNIQAKQKITTLELMSSAMKMKHNVIINDVTRDIKASFNVSVSILKIVNTAVPILGT